MKYLLLDENNEFMDSVEVELISSLPDEKVLVEDKNGTTMILSKKYLLVNARQDSN